VRQAPDDLVVHAGHDMAVVVHEIPSQCAEQDEEAQAPNSSQYFKLLLLLREGNACHVVLDSVIANAKIEIQIGTHLLGRQFAQTLRNLAVGVIHVAEQQAL